MTKRAIYLIFSATAVISTVLLSYWLFHDPSRDLYMYTPGMDNPDSLDTRAAGETIVIGEHFAAYGQCQSSLKASWPQFRGNDRNNILLTSSPINLNWKTKEPQVIWSAETGEGHAAPAVFEGRVYLLDYDESLRADMLRCFRLDNGEELWRRWYNVPVKRNHGMSRTIPALNGKYVVSMGPRCHVMCTDRLNGDFYWGLDLEKQYDTEIPLWYTGQCPLLDDSIAVIAPGGTVLMTGIDCASGKSVWETPNPDQWKMSHSSIIPASFLGKKMYIYAAIGGICGVSAEGEDRGKLLWKLGDWSPSVIAPAPLPLNDNSLFVTGGYGAGGAIIRISRNGDDFSAALQAAWLPHEGLASEQQTPLLYRGYVYGILPKDAGANRNQLMRYQQGNLQEADWQSGKTLRFGLGPYMILNDHLLVLNDEGTLYLFRLSGKEPEELHHVKLFEGQDAWGPLAFADNYLLLRDSKKIYCIDLKP